MPSRGALAIIASFRLGSSYPPPATVGRRNRRATKIHLHVPFNRPHGVPGPSANPVGSTLAEAYLVSRQHRHARVRARVHIVPWLPLLPVSPQSLVLPSICDKGNMSAILDSKALEANEKGEHIYTNDVNSSQASTPDDLDEYPDPDAGKSDEERARLV